MSKYSAGDKVIVKKGLKSGNDYGNVYFNSDMVDLIGKEFTIKKVRYSGSYDVQENDWEWSDAMLDEFVAKNAKPSNKIRIVFNENATIAKSGGKQGFALCNPDDEYDVLEGIRVAVSRLLDIDVSEKTLPKVKALDEYSIKELLEEIAKRVK